MSHSRESLLAPQYPRPNADLRLCAPPPEYRCTSAAPAHRSRPPALPRSSTAQRLALGPENKILQALKRARSLPATRRNVSRTYFRPTSTSCRHAAAALNHPFLSKAALSRAAAPFVPLFFLAEHTIKHTRASETLGCFKSCPAQRLSFLCKSARHER